MSHIFWRSPPSKRKSTSTAVKQEVPSPEKEKENNIVKKTETPKKATVNETPSKKSPAKKKSPKSAGKAKSKKASPLKAAFQVKTENQSPVKKEKTESPTKIKSETEKEENTAKDEVKEEKPKNHPFFSKQKDIKLQSNDDTSNGASYNPGKTNYHPINDCFWKHGEKYVIKMICLFLQFFCLTKFLKFF